MAQIVKLKRTSVSGKTPTTSNLALGELAMNTYDGRIFFEKSSSEESIQEILTTNSHPYAITGSLYLNGAVTASGVLVSANILPTTDNTLSLGSSTKRFQLNGGTPVTVNGSGTTNTLTRFQSATTVEDSNIVSSDTSTTFTHSNNGNTIFTVSGSNGELLTITDSNTGNLLEVNDASGIDVFTVSAVGDVSASGAITASGFNVINNVSVTGNISGSSFNGTGLISSSAQVNANTITNFDSNVLTYINSLDVASGSVASSWNDLSNIPAGIISGSSQVVSSLVNQPVNFGTGAVTASFFKGDGSQLTNLPSSIGIDEATTVTASYVDVDDITITHNFNTYNVLVSVYDNDRNLLIPATTSLPTVNTSRVTLSNTQSGFVVVAKGGHLISGSQIADNANQLNSQPGSYYLSWNNFNNIPSNIVSSSAQTISNLQGSGVVSGSSQITDGSNIVSGSSQLQGFVSASGNFVSNETIIATGTNSVTSSNILALDTTNNYLGINQSNPEVTLHMTGQGAQSAQIRMEQHNDSGDAPDIRTRKSRGTSSSPSKNNSGDFIYRQNSERYDGSSYVTVGQLAVDTNSSNADRFQLTLAVSEDGGTVDAAQNQFKIDGNDSGAITFNGAYKFPTSDGSANEVLSTNGSGTLSFTKTTHKETVSGASSYVVDHNLGEQYPIVQAWNTATSQQELPTSITTNSTNRVTVVFSTTFAGIIIVKK